jgi:hypothetical protein
MVYGKGAPDSILSDREVKEIIEAGTPATVYENKRVLVLTPDRRHPCHIHSKGNLRSDQHGLHGPEAHPYRRLYGQRG